MWCPQHAGSSGSWDGLAGEATPRANGSRPHSAAQLRRALAQAEHIAAERDLLSAGDAESQLHAPTRRATMSSLSPAARTALGASTAASGHAPPGRQRTALGGSTGLARSGGGSGNFAGLIVGARPGSGLAARSAGGAPHCNEPVLPMCGSSPPK
jgi:hypothetical protein